MLVFIFSILLSLLVQVPEEQVYFYFGNDNLIGVGYLEEGKKSGEWKVYSKTNPVLSEDSNFEQVDSEIFNKNFNQEVPLYLINFEEDVPQGIFQENYPSGAIKTLAFFENGKLSKDYKEFFENGELKYTGQLVGGKREGEWQEYFETGKLKSKKSYLAGLLDGESLNYALDGSLELKLVYSKGERNGLYQSFFSNGEIKEKGMFKNGVPEGEWISLSPDNRIQFQGSFQDGFRSGEWLETIEIIPEFSRKGDYKEGLREGEWFVIDGDGKQVQIENYQAGKLISVIELQHAANLKSQTILNKGNGQRIFFDDQGFVKAKGKVSKGEVNGNWSYYFPNSNRLASSGKLVGSERIGTWRFYNFEGEVIDQIEYKSAQKSVNGLKGGDTPNYYRLSPEGKNDSLGAAYEKFYPFNQYWISN